ncbi:hypothetical protein HanHA300_Chr06g0212801 [Helianthus annuus]|nr:hypothetical protein HanHA300_Chr06g0212801 [Helianthus annuus]KAJ0573597.1 hypothetical protein HanHA89_Chr06g0228511 [Helianthus annuus]KAJ0737960.1 hypothetical protein HanLR1_Chr06g0212741 [Helianthus annuus]
MILLIKVNHIWQQICMVGNLILMRICIRVKVQVQCHFGFSLPHHQITRIRERVQQPICMEHHNQLPQSKQLLSEEPICMEHHNQLPQRKAIRLLEYHHFLIQTTMVKQERRFMPKLSRMSVMVSPREMITILNMAVVQLMMLHVQLRMVQV